VATELMIVWRNCTSEISRLFLASRSWFRGASTLKPLRRGWVMLMERLEL
jgi:hypothetical protein